MKKKLALFALVAVAAKMISTRRTRVAMNKQVVMITGASRGLGLQIARESARAGAAVGLLARDEEELARAQDSLGCYGTPCASIICDVRNEDDVKNAVTALEKQLGQTDILYNVAGTIRVGPFAAQTTQRFHDEMAVNFFGSLHAIAAVLPAMRERRNGTIVNISSIGGVVPVPHLLPYVASKFAQRGLSEGLAAELASSGVRVCTVIPGLMRTGSPPHALFSGDAQAEYAWFSAGVATPLSSVSVEHAARVIVNAVRRGEQRVTVSPQAKVLELFYNYAPGAYRAVAAAAASIMPRFNGNLLEQSGAQSETPFTQSPALALSHHAEQTQNED